MLRSSKLLFVLIVFLFSCSDETEVLEPPEPRDLIEILRDDLPAGGEIRKEAILALDDFLKSDEARNSEKYVAYYQSMLDQVSAELKQEITTGLRIWAMYNHGFIVKTPSTVFAFDLVKGYRDNNDALNPWNNVVFPMEILDQIEILFISHSHGDHWDNQIKQRVISHGGEVIYPGEVSGLGTVPLRANDTQTVKGVNIIAHNGLHSVPNRMYEVNTPEGFKIIHTGDNQHSNTLPILEDLDILLVNAWVNESGSQHAIQGMKNCIYKLEPRVTIPGHFQELAHDWKPGSVYTRVPFEWGIEVADAVASFKIEILTWGEGIAIPPN